MVDLASLPPELLLEIFLYLDAPSLLVASLVTKIKLFLFQINKAWNRLITLYEDLLWKPQAIAMWSSEIERCGYSWKEICLNQPGTAIEEKGFSHSAISLSGHQLIALPSFIFNRNTMTVLDLGELSRCIADR